jgi:dipeptide/tripeptide permease
VFDDGGLTHKILSSVGLFVIAVGTGGIKPCVSAFGGDQFKPHQDGYRRSFFSLFYFAINAGSLVSTFVSPIIRDEVKCFDEECYAVAFGIPAALMVIAILSFVVGTKWYTRVAPEGNVFAQSCVCIYDAIKKRDGSKKDHWLDHADDGSQVRKTLIRDLKYVLRVLSMYILLPLFWALFDQQGE